MVWTNAVTIVSDFINNDPTSFTAISEAGAIESFLEAVAGHPAAVKEVKREDQSSVPDGPAALDPDERAVVEIDGRHHPLSLLELEKPRTSLARGILPSAEAIGVIPSILNSICLNNAGMRMVRVIGRLRQLLRNLREPSPRPLHGR